MKKLNLDGVIYIVREKKLNSIPSKGRNQWLLLKQFDGKKVREFINEAQMKSKNTDMDLYQESSWWYREIDWNLERGNIEIRSK